MKYCKHRYSKRQFRWKGSDPLEDETLSPSLRLTDLLCFSSQYYFILSFSAVGGLSMVFALQLLLRQTDSNKLFIYNGFGDKMLPFIILIVYAFCKVSLIHFFRQCQFVLQLFSSTLLTSWSVLIIRSFFTGYAFTLVTAFCGCTNLWWPILVRMGSSWVRETRTL